MERAGRIDTERTFARELDWLVPSAIIALFEMVLARSGDLTTVYSVLAFAGAFAVFVVRTVWRVAGMALTNEQHPIARLAEDFDPLRLLFAVAGIAVASLSFSAFTVLKTQIHMIVPFYADGPLAAFDHMILGRDAWAAFNDWFGWALKPISLFYGLWAAIQLIAFTMVLFARPSNAKSQALISHMLTWLVFGFFVACLLSSAGPIFFDQVYGGDRFAGLKDVLSRSFFGVDTAEMLWRSHETGKIMFGVGISAMPSLHVGTAVWIALVLRHTRFFWLAIAYVVTIYLGSVMLGWHYMTDGIVGAAGTWVCFALTGFVLDRRERWRGRGIPTGPVAAESATQ